jgi:SAM-dependent methyltransferase
VDGVWVLWSDAVRRVQFERPSEDDSIEARVKRANIEVYDEITHAYEEHSDKRFSYTDQILFLKAIAADRCRGVAQQAPRRRTMVDVGCGPGVGLESGAGLFDRIVGLDISLGNLRAVQAKGYLAVLGDADRLPFRPGAVDVITCFGALHHFPDPAGFMVSGHEVLRPGGALLTGLDPSRNQMSFGPLARLIWDLRKPVYRTLARFSPRFYLHQDEAQQNRNDLAEHSRTAGGFAPEQLEDLLRGAGFSNVHVFYGIDSSQSRRWGSPGWKLFLLESLSFRNPFACQNWGSLSAVAQKAYPSADGATKSAREASTMER